MVNRIWRWHFGQGLVATPDNFGALGARPSNPPLLDWLAHRFIDSGWSIKAMHRLIMLSSTYQMASDDNSRAAQIDPENRLCWRMDVRRLEAEEIRDALLAVGGSLDRRMGGSLLTSRTALTSSITRPRTPPPTTARRRSVYLPVVRNHLYDVFQLFDYADPSVTSGDRATTTVAPQALFMINGDLVLQAARDLAAGLLGRRELDDAGRIVRLYENAYGRLPDAAESRRAAAYLDRFARALQAEDEAGAADAAPPGGLAGALPGDPGVERICLDPLAGRTLRGHRTGSVPILHDLPPSDAPAVRGGVRFSGLDRASGRGVESRRGPARRTRWHRGRRISPRGRSGSSSCS